MRALACLAALAVASMTVAVACSSPDNTLVTQVAAPDYTQFEGPKNLQAGQSGVSRVLEQRCGSLDCHGQVGRPLRLYSQNGLRFVDDAGNTPGMGGASETERLANYQSVVALQPELTSNVVLGNAPPETLILLRKPLGLERHKGGTVFVGGDDTYTCIASWLESAVPGNQPTDFTSCGKAAQIR